MRICLSMIVKNESAVIARCLHSVLPYIDAWAICDTGSDDATPQIIANELRHLPGELLQRPWVDFAHNRNEALALARRHGSHALIIDADDELSVSSDAEPVRADASGYLAHYAHHTARYLRTVLVNLTHDWQWQGVLHEVLVCTGEHPLQPLRGWHIRSGGDGARSGRPASEKYADDARVLQRALRAEPRNSRYAFYFAQSLRDAGLHDHALSAYQYRVHLGGWWEEVYVSLLAIAALLELRGDSVDAVCTAYQTAYQYRPQRAEAPCELARYLRQHSQYTHALAFARAAAALPLPDDQLYVDTSVYAWRARDEIASALFHLGAHEEYLQLGSEVLLCPTLPTPEYARIERNLQLIIG